jgi:hypothetical protein
MRRSRPVQGRGGALLLGVVRPLDEIPLVEVPLLEAAVVLDDLGGVGTAAAAAEVVGCATDRLVAGVGGGVARLDEDETTAAGAAADREVIPRTTVISRTSSSTTEPARTTRRRQ